MADIVPPRLTDMGLDKITVTYMEDGGLETQTFLVRHDTQNAVLSLLEEKKVR